MKRIVVYGATSEIAHQLTRLLAHNEECFFVLIGRNKDRLDTVCKDLKVEEHNLLNLFYVTFRIKSL